jgi:hypothetical protein
MNAYKVPTMESRETTGDNPAWRNEWRYVTPDGVIVVISQKDKRFQIYQGDTEKLKGNFN